jgi:membrane protein YqaA with SNARE-associated domain
VTWLYGIVFLSAFAVDVIPLIAPPAWTVALFLLVKFHLHPLIVLPLCASGSTLGRYLMSLYIPRFAGLFIKRHKTDELKFLGKKLSQSLWQSWLFVFIYSMTPLSTTALFTAAGVAKVKPSRTVPPYFCGKFLSDAVMIFTGLYAAANFKDLVNGWISVSRLARVAATKEVHIQFQNLEMKSARLFSSSRARCVCGEDFALACRVRRLAGRHLFNAETQRTQSATPSNSALQPPLASLISAAYRMAKADTQKAKGDIGWQSARTFGQEQIFKPLKGRLKPMCHRTLRTCPKRRRSRGSRN